MVAGVVAAGAAGSALEPINVHESFGLGRSSRLWSAESGIIGAMPTRLYGTETSPYVRRVRVLAHELGLEGELVDTSTEEGQAKLREASPIWKVPALETDNALVYDSRIIVNLLAQRYGGDKIAAVATDDVETNNVLTVIDGALDALINCFYLGRDGVTPEAASYLAKHRERAASAMAWLESKAEAGALGELGAGEGITLVDIALGTTLAWMGFRQTYEVGGHPTLAAALARYEARPSFKATMPPVSRVR